MVERLSFSTTKVLYNSLLILSHLVHSDNSSRPVCSGDSEFILNIMTTKLFLKFIDKFEDNFDDNLLPLEVLKTRFPMAGKSVICQKLGRMFTVMFLA